MKSKSVSQPWKIGTEPPRQKGSEFEHTETPLLFADILVRLDEIANRAAAGEHDAAKFLLGASRHGVVELTALIHEQPDLFRELAAKSPQWPVLDSFRNEDRRTNLDLFKELGLGSAAQINTSSNSKWSRNHATTRYALRIIERIMSGKAEFPSLKVRQRGYSEWMAKAFHLPPFSKSSVEKWWEVGEKAFLEEYPEPWKLPELREQVIESSVQRGRFKNHAAEDKEILRRIHASMRNLAGASSRES